MIDSVILLFPRIIDILNGLFACDLSSTDEYNESLSLSSRLRRLSRSISVSLIRSKPSNSLIRFKYPSDISRYYFSR